MTRPAPKPGRLLPAALALGVAIAALVVAYGRVIPFGQAPDESAHWQYVQYLTGTHRLPVFSPGQGGYEFHQPPLYYLLAALPAGGGPLAARLANLPLALLLALFAGLLGWEYAGSRRVALAVAAAASLLPMQVFLDATINNDLLLQVCFAALLWLAVRGLRRGWSWGLALGMGVAAGLGLLTKNSAVVLLPVGMLALLLAPGRGQLGRVAGPAVFLGAALAVGGWWLVRNQALYGDPLALAAFRRAFTHCPGPGYFYARGLGPLGYGVLVAGWTWASFWGVFGNMDRFLPTSLYVVLGLLPLGAAAGGLRREGAGEPWQARAWVVMLAAVALLLGAFVQFNTTYFQAQARYLLPAVPVYALLLVRGWQRLGRGRAGRWTALVPALALAVVAAWALPAVLIPAYHP